MVEFFLLSPLFTNIGRFFQHTLKQNDGKWHFTGPRCTSGGVQDLFLVLYGNTIKDEALIK